MIRALVVFLLLAGAVWGEDVPPVTPPPVVVEQPRLTAGETIPGDGSRKAPYVFGLNTKCVLRLTGGVESAVWDKDDCPSDFEVIGNVGIFSLAEPGLYVVYVRGGDWHTKAWFQVDAGQGPRPPPPVEDGISKRVKAALAGNPGDAIRFATVCDGMAKALEGNTIQKLGKMESSMKMALDALQPAWVPGKYPDLSTLCGELFGLNVGERVLTDVDKAAFAKQYRLIATACREVK